MYRAIYIFRVPRRNVEAYMRITREAREIYRRYGAGDVSQLRLTCGDGKYGCVGLNDLLPREDDEEVFVGIDSFNDAAEYRELMARIDADPRINELYEQIQELVDLSRVVRWEAEDVD